MRQKTYRLEVTDDINDLIEEIREDHIVEGPGRSLILVNEFVKITDKELEDARLLREAFPGVHIIGATMFGPSSPAVEMFEGLMMTVLTFDRSGFDIFSYDCRKTPVKECGSDFSAKLNGIDDAQGILYLSAGKLAVLEFFLKAFPSELDSVPLFGIPAGVYDQQSDDQPEISLDGKVFDEGIITVVFHGDDLHVRAGFCLGFKPMGPQMQVTDGDDTGLVTAIDDMRPMDIYSKYFRITGHKPTFEELCHFPLLVGEGDTLTTRIPLTFNKGGFYFSTSIPVGNKVSFSYAKTQDLLKGSLRLANYMADFGPEAMIGAVCESRLVCLGNELGNREMGYYSRVNPDVFTGFGYGEILRINGKGGFRNGSFVMVGMREGAKKLEIPEVKDPAVDRLIRIDPVMADWLVTFLEEASKDMKYKAHHDSLTGLYNREALEQRLDRIRRGYRIFMFDVDRFKDINDLFGYDRGDKVLKRVARVTEAEAGKGVLVYRFGGDEFLCLSDKLDDVEMMEAAERIRKGIRGDKFLASMGVTVSGGVAASQSDGREFKDVYHEADLAMYHSKHYGGDRVSRYTDKHEAEMDIRAGLYQFPSEAVRFIERSEAPMCFYQLLNHDYHILIVSDGYCRMMGMSRQEAMVYLSAHSMSKVSPDDAYRLRRSILEMEQREKNSIIYKCEIGGSYHDILCIHRRVEIEDDSLVVSCHICDLDDARADVRSEFEDYIASQKDKYYLDEMTGLPGIRYFNAFANRRLDAIREDGKTPVLVYFDVTGMHAFNDRFGYAEGNKLLSIVGRVIAASRPGKMIVRYTDDHFILIDGGFKDPEERLRDINRKIVSLMPKGDPSVKVGIYECRDRNETAVSCLDKARQAFYTIGDDRNRFLCVYSDEVKNYYSDREYVITHFREALDNGWIETYFQPIHRTLTGKLCGSEVLARWVDPKRGVLEPDSFIQALEDTRMIYLLDLEIVRHVCGRLRDYFDRGVSTQALSINLSRVDFQTCDIFAEIEKIRERYAVPPEYLHMEITESALVSSGAGIEEAIEKFRSHGYAVMLDDFGAGYSSLNTLKDFGLDWIKIDMSFMEGIEESQAGKTIVTSVVELAKRLGIHTLCEGVETEAQYGFLKEIGCEACQGYYFSKPLPAGDMVRYALSMKDENYEPLSEYGYYEKIGMLDMTDDPMGDSDDQGSRPLALIEKGEDGALRVAFMNHAFERQRSEFGFSHLDFERKINGGSGAMRAAMFNMMEEAKAEGMAVRSVKRPGGDVRISVRLRFVAGDGKREMYAGMPVVMKV